MKFIIDIKDIDFVDNNDVLINHVDIIVNDIDLAFENKSDKTTDTDISDIALSTLSKLISYDSVTNALSISVSKTMNDDRLIS